jgi:hypothetical protein
MAEHIETEASGNALMQALQNIKVPQQPAGTGRGGGAGGTKMMKNPVDGTQVSRTDYMRALAANGWTRPQILAHVQEVTGDKTLRYQTVHQATKDFYAKRGGDAPTGAAEGGEGGDGDEYDNE